MVEVPRIDHLWDGQKEPHNDEKITWWIGTRIECIPKIACFNKSHSSLTMLGSPIGAPVGLYRRQQTMIHVELSPMCDWVMLNGQNAHIVHEHV